MEKVLKILKINLLSLIALPLLLIATCAKLIAKALSKVTVILSTIILSLILILGFKVFKNPDSSFQAILFLVVLFVVCFAFIAICVILMRFAAAVITTVWNACIGIFEVIYDWTYTGFLKLYASCENDYQYISLNGKKVPNAFLCLFYTILRFINNLIVTVVSFALPASIILSVLIVGGSLLSFQSRIKNTFGIGLLDYIDKFDTFSAAYCIVMYIAMMAMIVMILLSTGIEWYEWAKEMKLSVRELAENIADLRKSRLHIERDEESSSETGDAYLNVVEEHLENLDSLGELVEEVLRAQDNALLRNIWGNYFRNLSDITKECSKSRKGISMAKFNRLIPRIQQLEKQRKEVKSMANKLLKINDDPIESSVFFNGCNTLDKLEKRYKSLCKTYHPDAGTEDSKNFRKMQKEYNALKEYLSEDESE